MGLVRSFVKRGQDASYYVHCIYAPYSAAAFLADPLLGGTLEKTLGKERVDELRKANPLPSVPSDMEEVSQTFNEYFAPSFGEVIQKNSALNQPLNNAIPISFERPKFEVELRRLGINPKSLSEEEFDTIGKLAELYRLNEESIASLVFNAFEENRQKGQRLNFKKLSELVKSSLRFSYARSAGEKSQVSGNGDLAKKIKLMDETNPVDFLKLVQGNKRPPRADLNLIETLAGLGLPYPCINALIDFVLQKKHNTLPASYTEKIAGALVREGCKSARDAMDYLYTIDKEMRGQKGGKKPAKPYKNEEKQDFEPEKQEEVSDEEIQALLSGLDDED